MTPCSVDARVLDEMIIIYVEGLKQSAVRKLAQRYKALLLDALDIDPTATVLTGSLSEASCHCTAGVEGLNRHRRPTTP